MNFTRYDPAKCDIWSCGIILYCMLRGKVPFKLAVPEDPAFATMVASGSFPWPRDISKPARDLLSSIVRVNATERPTADDVLNSEWCRSVVASPLVIPRWEEEGQPQALRLVQDDTFCGPPVAGDAGDTTECATSFTPSLPVYPNTMASPAASMVANDTGTGVGSSASVEGVGSVVDVHVIEANIDTDRGAAVAEVSERLRNTRSCGDDSSGEEKQHDGVERAKRGRVVSIVVDGLEGTSHSNDGAPQVKLKGPLKVGSEEEDTESRFEGTAKDARSVRIMPM